MRATVHHENFVTIRALHPAVSARRQARYISRPPSGSTELDYRDLLSEANEAFFHREYQIALRLYLELRNRILIQSHPELPPSPVVFDAMVLDVDNIQIDRIFELSRRLMINVEPGDQVTIPIDMRSRFSMDEVAPNSALAEFASVTIDPSVVTPDSVKNGRRRMRELAVSGDFEKAHKVAQRLAKSALDAGNTTLSAEVWAESASLIATFASRERAELLIVASKNFQTARNLYRMSGDIQAMEIMTSNLAQLNKEPGHRPQSNNEPVPRPRPNIMLPMPGGSIALGEIDAGRITLEEIDEPLLRDMRVILPKPVTSKVYLTPDGGNFKTASMLVNKAARSNDQTRSVGLMTTSGPNVVSLSSSTFSNEVKQHLYESRVNATSLAEFAVLEMVPTTFVAYIPHLFFYVLPMAIAETYVELGSYGQAQDHYASVLKYPFLNANIEVADLWRRMATAQLRHGDELFRQESPALAKLRYETIVSLPAAIPNGSPLYQPGRFALMRNQAREVVKDLLGQASNPINPKVSEIVMRAFAQLTKINGGLNFLGLSADYAPVQRFRYLQAAAQYMADNAIQAERSYIQFRSQAEQQKFERLQLENAVDLNKAALDIEKKRAEDAALEVEAARETRQLTELRHANAQANLADWNTLGRELASVNAALSWASNAANDQDINYSNVYYDGESHDYSGDVEDFYDTVGEVREWLNFDIQRNRFERQVAEGAAEVTIAQTREEQAIVRAQVQQLNQKLAEVRVQGSLEILAYNDEQMFGEDLWFRLAGDMEDLARNYLDMAIETAFVMERAYDLEFDRNLNRIRLDYGIGGPEGLLGGDQVKRDIASFTLDYIQHGKKHNPIRLPLSLREEFPHAFNQFQTNGLLQFRTDLEMFDRRFAGTFQRKIKRIEIFVEGLIPPEGVHGTLAHEGLTTEWRHNGVNWAKHSRVHPTESMVISSHQHRRDLAVIQPPEELLALFENLGPQGNWTLHLPSSANNLDFGSISDVKLVMYFDADYDEGLVTHQKATYGNTGGRALVLSSRFHYPDQYFRLEMDRRVQFTLPARRLKYFVTDPVLDGFAVSLVAADGTAPLAGRELVISRDSDGSTVTATTDANGTIRGDSTNLAPFSAWQLTTPVDTWSISFADGDDLSDVLDVHLALSYKFAYRADAV